MIKAYRAADVRAAEAPLLAAGEPLMERRPGRWRSRRSAK